MRGRWAETKAHIQIFLLVLVWDWLTTAGVQYMAARSGHAITLAVAVTAFWFFAVGMATKNRRLVWAACAGAACGTAIAIYAPLPGARLIV